MIKLFLYKLLVSNDQLIKIHLMKFSKLLSHKKKIKIKNKTHQIHAYLKKKIINKNYHIPTLHAVILHFTLHCIGIIISLIFMNELEKNKANYCIYVPYCI